MDFFHVYLFQFWKEIHLFIFLHGRGLELSWALLCSSISPQNQHFFKKGLLFGAYRWITQVYGIVGNNEGQQGTPVQHFCSLWINYLIILSLDSPCCWMTSYGILGNFSGVLHEILGIHGFHLCCSPLYLFWVLCVCVCLCVYVCVQTYTCILNTLSLIDSNFQKFH